MRKYESFKKFITETFIGKRPDKTPNFYRDQSDAESLKNTLATTGWAKLSERFSNAFVDDLREILDALRLGNYDRDKILVQTAIVLARMELIDTIDQILQDGEKASEELNKLKEAPQSIEELAART